MRESTSEINGVLYSRVFPDTASLQLYEKIFLNASPHCYVQFYGLM